MEVEVEVVVVADELEVVEVEEEIAEEVLEVLEDAYVSYPEEL